MNVCGAVARYYDIPSKADRGDIFIVMLTKYLQTDLVSHTIINDEDVQCTLNFIHLYQYTSQLIICGSYLAIAI